MMTLTKTRLLIILVALLSTLLAPVMLFAQNSVSPIEAMQQANSHYEAGRYAEAIVAYEAMLAAGVDHSDVYYNLGNAYFKNGDLGQAILNYRRAQRLDPRDGDVAANLETARAQTVDRIGVADGEGTDWVTLAEEWLTLNEAAVLALALWLLICYFAVLSIIVPRMQSLFRWAMAGLGLFLILGLISMSNRAYIEWQTPAAVILAEEVPITTGPGSADNFAVEFTLHAGTEVRLLERRPGWQRITLPGELGGWVPVEAVEAIDPET